MADQTPVTEKIRKFLAETGSWSGRNSVPHLQIFRLYKEYREESVGAGRKSGAIVEEFAGLFQKTVAWAYNYHRLINLQPELLEKLGRTGPDHLSFSTALDLAKRPAEEQLAILRAAEKRSAAGGGPFEKCVTLVADSTATTERHTSPERVAVAERSEVPTPAEMLARKPIPGDAAATLAWCQEGLRFAFHYLAEMLELLKSIKAELRRDKERDLHLEAANSSVSVPPPAPPPAAKEVAAPAPIVIRPIPEKPHTGNGQTASQDVIPVRPTKQPESHHNGNAGGGERASRMRNEDEEPRVPRPSSTWAHGEVHVHHAKPGRY